MRLAAGLITTRNPPLADVTLADGSVNVSIGVPQAASPVHSRIVFSATVETASLNANSMLRSSVKFGMLCGGSDRFASKTGATVSGLASKNHAVVLDIAAVVLPAKSANAPASYVT